MNLLSRMGENMKKQTAEEKKAYKIKKIMDAAIEIFAQGGYAGARMDEIAKKAEINKAMIYYRIGDKKALYSRVLKGIFADAAEIITERVSKGKTPEEKIVLYVRALTNVPEIHPYLPNIMMWELASGGMNFPPVIATDFVRILGLLTSIIKDGCKKGVFSETNPFMLQMMIVGTMAFCKTTAPLRTRFASLGTDLGLMEKELETNISSALEKLVLNAIKK